ncbi:dihydrofolate reductase family protein [Nocardioides sp. Bht2]|uniref:dihydrofolate reductase family protein n=1 Tax=Nocardioides sp. Bht2 TaxID=3392297 RepID=UPI0039B48182
MTPTTRRVVANIAISMDGYFQGPGGPTDMGWLMPYATSEIARDHLTKLWRPATTALLGRTNAEGFFGYWPTVADDVDADPRDREYGAWMRDVEKVVLSTTLSEAPWAGARVFAEPVAKVVDRLQEEVGGDIVVFSSATVIRDLLVADRVDRLSFTVFPELLGGGNRLFQEGIPASRWTLAEALAGDHGVLSIAYDRSRSSS